MYVCVRVVHCFTQVDIGTGKGYAVWLQNPPQTLRILSTGQDAWVAVDLDGNQYQVQASAGSGGNHMADTLTVGSGSSTTIWMRNTSGEGHSMIGEGQSDLLAR
jgi:hypothetical protein